MQYCVPQKKGQAIKLWAEDVWDVETGHYIKIKCDTSSIGWRDWRKIYLINMHNLAPSQFFGPKPTCTETNSKHNGYTDQNNYICTTYYASHRMWKWTKKELFLQFANITASVPS